MNIIVDTDALLGLFNAIDALHKSAAMLAEKLTEERANIFLLPTTLAEFALLASSRVGVQQTKTAIDHLTQSGYIPVDVTEELTKEAVSLYQKQTSKEESLFDCYVMVAARKITADYIFSFDGGYTKNGFSLASGMLSS